MSLSEEQKEDIKNQRNNFNKTRRAISEGMEENLYLIHKVLDHGFVRVIDYMGNDSSIVQAARVSYGKGTKKKSLDEGLIRYLLRHKHTTPFEMCEIKLHVKLPIFIARQWIRHRTANVNEYSARYSILDKEFYIPAKEQLSAQSTSNRQGRGDLITGKQADEVLQILKDAVGIFFILHTFFINAFDPSNLAAYLLGPKTFILFFSKKSTNPLTKGSSGPIIIRSIL